MAKENYQIYTMCFRTSFIYNYQLMTGFFDINIPKYNGYIDFVRSFYYLFHLNKDSDIRRSFEKYYSSFYSFFIGYCYANNYGYRKIEYLMKELINNFDYYFDLINMNVKNISNNVYYYIESLVQEIENKDNKENNNIIIK